MQKGVGSSPISRFGEALHFERLSLVEPRDVSEARLLVPSGLPLRAHFGPYRNASHDAAFRPIRTHDLLNTARTVTELSCERAPCAPVARPRAGPAASQAAHPPAP